AWAGLLDGVEGRGGLKFRPMTLPDRFIDHDTQARQLIAANLTAKDITATALQALGIADSLPGAARLGR
ncbi:MAG TPA: hypothetical protein VLJ20_02345, partial [Acetobacteraceae bacterium]|nr:hypothetical protein [Acetobacteraceae bacterium]